MLTPNSRTEAALEPKMKRGVGTENEKRRWCKRPSRRERERESKRELSEHMPQMFFDVDVAHNVVSRVVRHQSTLKESSASRVLARIVCGVYVYRALFC